MIEFLSGLYAGGVLGSLIARLMTDRAWFKTIEKNRSDLHGGAHLAVEKSQEMVALVAVSAVAALDMLAGEMRKKWWAR